MPGLDAQIVDAVEHDHLLNRIKLDIRTDFILAPHLNSVFVRSPDELWALVREKLLSGAYQPELPITVSVPKERGFVRPGSILLPIDRVVYQLLIDFSAEHLEQQLDRTRTFSHVRAVAEDSMFQPGHECWERFQTSILRMCEQTGFIVKADIANYFERIPQHHLVNLMKASGCPGEVVNLTEELLLAFQERDSFGIVQGMFPSDMLGNFFLSDFDAYCDLNGIDSARYVDDIYMRFATELDARTGMISLIEHLRRRGLHLNEFKSGIHATADVIREETEVDSLFENARTEARERLADFEDTTYGFTAEWDIDDEADDEIVDLVAVQLLYDSQLAFPDQADKIDRFCLPLMRATSSSHAVDDVLAKVQQKPHMTRLYHAYLSRFVSTNLDVSEWLSNLIVEDNFVTDYERMYALGSLLHADGASRAVCNSALVWLTTPTVAKEARALAAILVAKHGNPNQKRTVRLAYEGEQSSYVRAAILYAAKYFTTAERRTCKRAWGGHNELNTLIARSI